MQQCVLVLIAPLDGPPLTRNEVFRALSYIPSDRCGAPLWLAPNTACEVVIGLDGGFTIEHVRTACKEDIAEDFASADPIDAAVVPARNRRKKLLVADMESTIIAEELLDELAAECGIHDEISEITARAMRGELDFESALQERVARFAGQNAALLEHVYNTRVTIMPGAQTLVKTMQTHGAYCALVSGGFTFFTKRIARRLLFDEHQGNRLIVRNGKIAGEIEEPILGRDAKHQALLRLSEARGLTLADALCVGDGANDLDMLKAAGLGVAFRAKPIVVNEAPVSVVHSDLTSLLYLQGYHAHDFVT